MIALNLNCFSQLRSFHLGMTDIKKRGKRCLFEIAGLPQALYVVLHALDLSLSFPRTKTSMCRQLVIFTCCLELFQVAPICKDNVVCLPKKLAQSLGGIGQVCVVSKVTHLLHLMDPQTCQCE